MNQSQPEQAISDKYDMGLDKYIFMSYQIAQDMKISPDDILNHWGVSFVATTYVYMVNSYYYSNLEEYKKLSTTDKRKAKRPEGIEIIRGEG